MDPRFPIGQRPELKEHLGPAEREELIARLAEAPARLRAAVQGLSDAQLDTPYREGGWTVRQVVHHLADSHMNSYVRFRLALTEDEPTIKPYDQPAWAELPDARTLPPEPSLRILEGVHERWVALLRALAPEQFARGFVNPERGRMNLDQALQIYAWHGRHHVAHITGGEHEQGTRARAG